MNNKTNKNLFISVVTVFVSNFCVMAIEITAGRLVAQNLGTSLFTWTTIIGVILAGIGIGNYLGGILADKYRFRKLIPLLFFLSSFFCLFIPVLLTLLRRVEIFIFYSLPVQVFLHIASVFLVPSVVLGMISPVIAKNALGLDQKTGFTIGTIYAWSAMGSIVGTFMTGYILIPFLGSKTLIGIISLVLGIMFFLYSRRKRASVVWVVLIFLLIVTGSSFQNSRIKKGFFSGFLNFVDANQIYSEETQYSYIRVTKKSNSMTNIRLLYLDDLQHNEINLNDPNALVYDYLKFFFVITRKMSQGRNDIRTLQVGGGGYSFPQYIRQEYPESHVEVIEIDPAVTKAAVNYFGLKEDSGIRIHHMDGRVAINNLLVARGKDPSFPLYDFIYTDVFSSVTVPSQLTTIEYLQAISELMSPEGAYMINLIDILNEGEFINAVYNTFMKVFPYVYVFNHEANEIVRRNYNQTFVIVGSKKRIDLSGLAEEGADDVNLILLKPDEIIQPGNKRNGLVLTDNYAPVENLLMNVAGKVKFYNNSRFFENKIQLAYQKGKLKYAYNLCQKVLKLDPYSIIVHNYTGCILGATGNARLAEIHFLKAIEINPRWIVPYGNIGAVYLQQGQLDKAISLYRKTLELDPEYAVGYYSLGLAYDRKGDLMRAKQNYQKALKINPNFKKAQERYNELRVLMKQGT